MKKSLFLFRLLALVATLTCALGASADVYNFYYNGIYYDLYDDASLYYEWSPESFAEVSSGPDNFHYSGSVTIPSSVTYNGKTYPVAGISYAFSHCTGLTSVTIPASVKLIGTNAFYGCTGLTSVTSLATTPPDFYDTDFTLEDLDPFSEITYTKATLYVPHGCKDAYRKNTGYWRYWYKFRDIVEKACDFVVNGIYYNITGTNTVEVTFDDDTYNTYSGNVTIPSSVSYGGKTYTVTAIGNHAFDMSIGLTKVTIPSTVTAIGESAFSVCTRLTGVTIPTSVTTIGKNAFSMSGIKEVLIPGSVTTLGWGAFNMCDSLKSVVIAEGLTYISAYAFATCYALKNVTIPNSVKEIGEHAFAWCI